MNMAFQELKKAGIKSRNSYSFGEVFPVSRDQKGQWFLCTKNGLHKEDERTFLSLNQFPHLKHALSLYEMGDSQLRNLGGRVFVSNDGVYRKK